MNDARSLSTIIGEIEEASKTAQTVLDTLHPSVRASHETAIRQANAAIKRLKEEYLVRLFGQTAALMPFGDGYKVEQLVRGVEGDRVFVANAAAPYQKLTDTVMPSIGHQKQFSSLQLMILSDSLDELVESSGYSGDYPRMKLTSINAANDSQQVETIIRNLVPKAVGNFLMLYAVKNTVFHKAYAQRFTDKVCKVVILNTSADDREALKPVFRRPINLDLDQVGEINPAMLNSMWKGPR